MRFERATQIELTAQAVGASVSIILAIRGAGYWALVAGTLTGQVVRVVLAFVLTGYRPGWPRRDPSTLSMMAFGGYLVASNVITYTFRNADNILIGRVWGAQELGYYTRAYYLMMVPAGLFTSSLNRVMVPALSALADNPERLGNAYRQAIRTLGFVGFPAAVGLAVTAPEAVRLVYGPNWSPVVPILAVLSASMVIQVVGGTQYWLYMAVGRGRLMFVVSLVATIFTVAGMLVGVRYGPVGVAVVFAIASAIILLPNWYIGHNIVGIPLMPTIRAILPSAIASIAMGVCAYLAGEVVASAEGDWLVVLTAKVSAGVLVYGAIALRYLRPWPVPVLERMRQRIAQSMATAATGLRHLGPSDS
jgi:polysaccharide transporter, PST family